MISETSLAAEQTAFLNLLCRGPECGNIIKYSIAGKKVKRTCASSRTEALVSTVNNGNTCLVYGQEAILYQQQVMYVVKQLKSM